MLHNGDGVVLLMFFKNVGRTESNEMEVLAILEALRILVLASCSELLVAESDSINSISSVSSFDNSPWKFQFYFNEIKYLSSLLGVKFQHVGRMGNSFADSFAKRRSG